MRLSRHFSASARVGKIANYKEESMSRFRWAVFVVLFSATAAWSQTATGRIVGTVSDPTGALIPGASVTVTNVNTQVTVETITNEQGAYQAPLLPIGTYTVTADMPGFQKAVT